MMIRLLFFVFVICGILPCMANNSADSFVGGRTDFRDESIYFVITTRFYDGDPSNNWQCWDNQEANEGDPAWRGDFKGLIEKLDYIKALGCTAVWITPIVQNASGYDYHGYHAMDMSRVDDRLMSHPCEDNDISEDVDFQKLIDEAHARGMKNILDIVLNHTGNFGENRLCQLFRRDTEANQATIDKCMIPVTTDMEDDWGNAGKLPTNYLQLPGGEQYQARLHEMKNNDSPGPNDGIRFNGGTDQWAENLDLMFTFRGIPCLYYGSEVEFRKGVKIDNGANGPLKDTGRAYFGGYIKGSVTPVGFGQFTDATGNIATTLSRPLSMHIARLSQIRQQIPALRKGQYSKKGCSSQGGYAFKRRYVADGIDSYALVTISAGATFTNVLNGTYVDVISGDVKEVTDGKLITRSFSGKGQMAVYVLNGEGKIGNDGPYLFDTTPASLPTLAYDGTEEEKSSNNGSAEGTTPSAGVDDLEVYVPSISSVDERSIFYEASADCFGVRIWVWNSSFGFTGSSWDARPSMQLMGKTSDGMRKIFKWTYEGGEASMPTGLIFQEYGGSQTADLVYVNNGYYIGSRYDHTVDNLSSISSVRIDNNLPSAKYTIDGIRAASTRSHGILLGKGYKIIK